MSYITFFVSDRRSIPLDVVTLACISCKDKLYGLFNSTVVDQVPLPNEFVCPTNTPLSYISTVDLPTADPDTGIVVFATVEGTLIERSLTSYIILPMGCVTVSSFMSNCTKALGVYSPPSVGMMQKRTRSV